MSSPHWNFSQPKHKVRNQTRRGLVRLINYLVRDPEYLVIVKYKALSTKIAQIQVKMLINKSGCAGLAEKSNIY